MTILFSNQLKERKTTMKKLFKAIKNDDLVTIQEILSKRPELISCTAKKPPKADDGQSLLQVALKNGNIRIANYLLEAGADVNFMESPLCENKWRTPVIHDAINAAIMTSRWNTNTFGFKVFSTREKADESYALLKRMLELGADPNAADSFGNSGLWRFCLQARQILPGYNHSTHTILSDRLLTEELTQDLTRIIRLLKEYGLNMEYVSPNYGKTALEQYKEEPVCSILSSD